MISAASRARDSVAQNGISIGSSTFAQFTRVPSKQTTPRRTGLHLKIVLRYFVNRALIVGGRSFDALAAAMHGKGAVSWTPCWYTGALLHAVDDITQSVYAAYQR